MPSRHFVSLRKLTLASVAAIACSWGVGAAQAFPAQPAAVLQAAAPTLELTQYRTWDRDRAWHRGGEWRERHQFRRWQRERERDRWERRRFHEWRRHAY